MADCARLKIAWSGSGSEGSNPSACPKTDPSGWVCAPAPSTSRGAGAFLVMLGSRNQPCRRILPASRWARCTPAPMDSTVRLAEQGPSGAVKKSLGLVAEALVG